MAKTARTAKSKTKKTRAPFVERFTARVAKLKIWAEKTQPRFATAPDSDIADALGGLGDTIDGILESIPKLKSWTPPTRSPAFVVGDEVVFKPKKLEELIKSGAYKKGELDGVHEIVAIAGRKVRLPSGLFQSLYVTKSV